MSYDTNKESLLNNLKPWWTSKGWNPKTLEGKSVNELLAIRSRMLYSK